MPTIEETLRTFIEKEILCSPGGFPYTDETSFVENGIIDSASLLALIAFVEEQFSIPVEDCEVVPENFDSIANLSRYIQCKVKTD
jgi:acyl carrier protein